MNPVPSSPAPSGNAGPQVSLVVPIFREAARLPATLPVLAAMLAQAPFSWEVLLVVEQSPDASLELAQAFARDHPGWVAIDNLGHRGKGYAVRSGMHRAQGGIVFYLDADLSTDLEAVGRFCARFAAEPAADVLIGNRHHPESVIVTRQGGARFGLGRIFNGVVRRLTGLPQRDTQCGFKAFRAAAARVIFARQRIDGFAFDVEVLLLAKALGLAVRDLPVQWTDSPHSSVRVVRDGLLMLRDVLRLKLRPVSAG